MKRKINLILMLVLACSMSAIAQSSTSSDSMNKDQMHSKKMSMTGCISEKNGKYFLTNKEHPDGVQLMTSEDLKPHVGHMMKITGMIGKMDAMSDDSMKSDEKMSKDEKMKHDKMGMGMKVSSMKMISDHCDMPMSK